MPAPESDEADELPLPVSLSLDEPVPVSAAVDVPDPLKDAVDVAEPLSATERRGRGASQVSVRSGPCSESRVAVDDPEEWIWRFAPTVEVVKS